MSGNLENVLVRGTAVIDEVNCHHNFIGPERDRGRDMWITRKRAIRARE